jgi:hypothetical protein
MDADAPDQAQQPGQQEAVANFRAALERGQPWPDALLDAMGAWPVAEEMYRKRRRRYFIAGEAFDWVLLAERLLDAADGLVPKREREDLLLRGRFPKDFDEDALRDRLGVEKYRGYLNYYYGVTVEEALQLAAEEQAHKRHISNGVRYKPDVTDEAFRAIYDGSLEEMLAKFREDTGLPNRRTMALRESKEFTYWLFKYRVKHSEPARMASDTKKGLDQLQKMRAAAKGR